MGRCRKEKKNLYWNLKEKSQDFSYGLTKRGRFTDMCVGINGIHCHLLLEESKRQGVLLE